MGVWGLTFKANTDDLRDSPALVVVPAAARRGRGGAGLRPRGRGGRRRARLPGLDVVADAYEAARRRAAAGAAHRVGRVPLARLHPRRRGDDARRAGWSTPATCSTRRRCAGAASRTRASGADAASSRHRRGGVPRFAPLRPAPRARVGRRRGRQLPHRPPRQRRAPRRRRRLHAGRARRHRRHPGRRRRSTRCCTSPARPARPSTSRIPIATLEVGAVGTRHALDLARAQRRTLPARVDERDLRRPARAPAARELLRQRQQRRAARGVRRGEALRRGDHDGVPPRVRRRHQDRAHLQHLRAPARARPTGGWCRTSSPRRCGANRSPSTATASRPGRSATSSDEVAGSSRCSTPTTSGR